MNASEAEVDGISLCAKSVALDADLFESPDPPSSDEWQDIHNFLETLCIQPVEQGISIFNSTRPYASSSRASNEPLNDHISTAKHYSVHARSEAIVSHPARPRSQSPDHLPTERSAADEYKLVRPVFQYFRRQTVAGGGVGAEGC